MHCVALMDSMSTVGKSNKSVVSLRVYLRQQQSFAGAYHTAMELMYAAAEAVVDSAKAHQACSADQCVA
jgi:hypothetical protein